LTAIEGLNAKQRMRVIADTGIAPPDEMVELFLNASGKNANGADFSGMPHYCKTKGLPVADWRDYKKGSAINILYPGAEVAK
ncbi:MAG: hypothetical protein ABI451_06750, partial [Dokdonella sp.]